MRLPTSACSTLNPNGKVRPRQPLWQWVPEYQQLHYPKPIVDHKFARQRAIDTYKAALDAVKS